MTIFRTFYKYLHKFHLPFLLSHFPLFKENGCFISKAFFTCSIACFSESQGSFLYLHISLIYISSLIILVCFHIYFDQVILVYTKKVDRKYTCLISMHLHGIFLCIVSLIQKGSNVNLLRATEFSETEAAKITSLSKTHIGVILRALMEL